VSFKSLKYRTQLPVYAEDLPVLYTCVIVRVCHVIMLILHNTTLLAVVRSLVFFWSPDGHLLVMPFTTANIQLQQ